VFLNGPAGSDMFSVLIGMRDSLRAGSAPTAAQLQALDDAQTLVLQSEGKAGTISQILDRTSTYLASQKEQLLSLRAAKQEIDVAEIGVKLQYEQTMLDAALAAGAKILPRSLMDFLT
jgi:flagellin-like hook-associated protein FlgL